MPLMETVKPKFHPRPPMRIEELGVPEPLLVDLFLRRAMLEGTSSLSSLCENLKLALPIIDRIFRQTRDQKLLDVKGMEGDDYRFSLTSTGRGLASDRFRISQYSAAAPVSLKSYQDSVIAQRATVIINRPTLREALSDLVVPDRLLDELGPAIVSQSSLFLYGPSGNGKTSIAERLHRVYKDYILVPRAVEVDSQIITLFDPVVHHSIEPQPWDIDPRWVMCSRPCIVVGGELVSSMLELRLESTTGTYAAPIQMKANNGIFIIDDFGRQMMSPRELLNRWIVPLDRHIDYLTLSYGVKFPIPFELLVIFSTNFDPRDLADDAFFRRIQNKIYVDPVTGMVFDEILSRAIKGRRIPMDSSVPEYFKKRAMELGNHELRACYPLDICKLLEAICRYESQAPVLNVDNLERALQLYFAPID